MNCEATAQSLELDTNVVDASHADTVFKARVQQFTYVATPGAVISNMAQTVTSPSQTPVRTSAGKRVAAKPSATTATSEKKTTRGWSAGTFSKDAIHAPVSKKRKSEDDDIYDEQTPTQVAKKRTTTKKRSAKDLYNPPNKLVDSLRPGLMLVMIGLNPGLKTAETGHAYAHPSNLFWKLLHWSGITPIKYEPKDFHSLMDLYQIGNTNLCVRPTRAGDGLLKEEQVEGVTVIERKMAEMKPEAVCIVGKGIWDVIYNVKTGKAQKKGQFQYGWQDESLWIGRQVDKDTNVVTWGGARTFVATSTSGLAANTKPPEKLAIWKPLGDWVAARRVEEIQRANGGSAVVCHSSGRLAFP